MSIDDDGFRRDEDLLRRALHAEADDVLPSLDALSDHRAGVLPGRRYGGALSCSAWPLRRSLPSR